MSATEQSAQVRQPPISGARHDIRLRPVGTRTRSGHMIGEGSVTTKAIVARTDADTSPAKGEDEISSKSAAARCSRLLVVVLVALADVAPAFGAPPFTDRRMR